ncbi:MAG: TlpA family protein disulfide reductase [Caldilineales bacterium]|nr:TlpA family protein disulfide reductase [Caldilineales bacterium]
MRSILRLLSLILFVALLISCNPIAPPLPSLSGTQPAPELTLPTPDGEMLSLADFRGDVVFVNFWGTYCPPCVAEMPDLQKVQDGLAGEPFTILSVNVEESPDVVQSWAEEHKLTFPVVISDDGTINPTLALHRMPTTWFVDADGVLRGKMEGQMSATTARKVARILLDELN